MYPSKKREGDEGAVFFPVGLHVPTTTPNGRSKAGQTGSHPGPSPGLSYDTAESMYFQIQTHNHHLSSTLVLFQSFPACWLVVPRFTESRVPSCGVTRICVCLSPRSVERRAATLDESSLN